MSTPKFGLPDNVIKGISEVFSKDERIQKVIIYGSRAKGNYKEGSDIDLTIIGTELTTTDLLRLENELDDLLLPYKIDLSLFHQIENVGLQSHINRVGVVFYCNRLPTFHG